MQRPLIRARLWLSAHWSWGIHLLFIAVEIVLLVAVLRKHPLARVPWPSFPNWWQTFPWAAVGTSIGAGITAVGALWALYVNRRLSQQQFDRKERNEEFTDILNRFADKDSPLMRANAAERLGAIAGWRLPGRPTLLTPESYPFFERAAAHLAAAVHMEEEAKVRKEVLGAVRRMVGFGSAGDQSLLHVLIRELADGNRDARETFETALAVCESAYSEALPATMLRQFDDTFLVALRASRSPPAQEMYVARTSEDLEDVLTAARLRAAQLADTGRALGIALRGLERDAIKTPDLGLYRCALWASNLENAHLHGANLAGAILENGHLTGVDLEGANLQRANLQQADVPQANLQGANLQGANLREAYLRGANLGRADLGRADLAEANLAEADLAKAMVWGADLREAELREANLEGADLREANLAGASLMGATYNKDTKWPKDFDPEQHGAHLEVG